MTDKGFKIEKVGMVGVGSMGSGLTLLMAENGYEVSFYDPSEKSVAKLTENVKNLGLQEKVKASDSYEALCRNAKTAAGPRVFVFSMPHGAVCDKTVAGLRPHLDQGDIIIDCANEHWENTERRQKDLEPQGIHYIGCGVSGGYQSARSGPSFSPGGDHETLEKLMPFFRKLAAKDKKGRPCVNAVGPGSSGHYTKMVHNGIEQGMMSVLAEVWFILVKGLGLSYEETSKVFQSWNEDGVLHDCFLIKIAADALLKREEGQGGHEGCTVVGEIRDNVVQDVDESEGTGNWTCEEIIALHMPAATIISAHLFRYASAYAAQRQRNKDAAAASRGYKMEASHIDAESRDDFIAILQGTTYFCFLDCFTQGLDLLRAKDMARKWGLNYRNVLQLWRGGCIIQADGIVDILDAMYAREGHDPDDLLANPEVAGEMARHASDAKEVVLRAVTADMFVPTISQSLEHFKYSTSTALPTQFMEAELDYFGQHMFDTWEDPVGVPKMGVHHFEWKRAMGLNEK